jgi:hypothetical protein
MSPFQGQDVLFVRDPRVARAARLPWAILCHAVGVMSLGAEFRSGRAAGQRSTSSLL